MLLYTIVAVLAITFIQPPSLATKTEPNNTHLKTAVSARESNKAIVAAEANTQGKPGSQPDEKSSIQSQSNNQSVAPAEPVKAQQQAPQAQLTSQASAPAGTCEEAIAAVWPADLQSSARLVSTKESSMIRDRIGPLKPNGTVGYNNDGSRDYGCFQINDAAHPQFFQNGDWRNPKYNAQYALRIYQEREQRPQTYKNGWTAWYAVRGILW